MAGSSGDCLEADLAENQLTEIEEARAFAQAIIDAVREPVLVLDQDLRVITASRSFYRTFKVGPEDTKGRLLYKLGDGHWNIPKLLPAGWAVGFPGAAQPAPLRGSPDRR